MEENKGNMKQDSFDVQNIDNFIINNKTTYKHLFPYKNSQNQFSLEDCDLINKEEISQKKEFTSKHKKESQNIEEDKF